MNVSLRYSRRIRPFVRRELDAAVREERQGDPLSAFSRLERAHILGQAATLEHVRVHWAMFRWALRQRVIGEAMGQAWRIVAAFLTTWLWVPVGNTGGADVSGLEPMAIPQDLQRLINAARR